jgi:hypothetical protein
MTGPRLLAASPAVLHIVYTPGADAEAKGYEPWLAAVDNPFFNAIPGVHHYANWKLECVLTGAPPYDYFDFQGLAAEADLERVWFNPDLDRFRTEWVRLWGYGLTSPPPIQANAYLMCPISRSGRPETRFGLVTGGTGAAPTGVDVAWRVRETIRKHYAIGPEGGQWRAPSEHDNPLGLNWLAIRYGDSVDYLAAAHEPCGESIAFIARQLAAPT